MKPWGVYYANERGALTRRQIVDFLYAMQGAVCLICGRYIRKATATVDHVVPRSRGGAHTIMNWALAHARCNSAKGDRMPNAEERRRHARLRWRIRIALTRIRVATFGRRLIGAWR